MATVGKTYQSASAANLSTTFNMRERQSVRLADTKEPSVLAKASPSRAEEKDNSLSAHVESRRLNDNAASSKKEHLSFSATVPKKSPEAQSSAMKMPSEFQIQRPEGSTAKVHD